jgi:diguanylate cyclase (GGDEF)-like protein
MTHERILIVDDEPDIAKILSLRLEANGYKTAIASNGEEALKRILQIPPDLILLDITMPKMNGLQLKNQLNKEDETRSIPVIFVTARNLSADKIAGLKLGVDDYITKPFNAEELLARIDSTIQRRKFYERVSMTDGLTGVYNVAFFKKQIGIFFQLAQRHKTIFSLAIIDINDFKIINDTYGHSVGDFVLKKIAEILRIVLRETDIITRYGGDEFVIILPETKEESAQLTINRIKEKIHGQIFRVDDTNIELSFTLSAGIATYDDTFTSEVHMFWNADNRLYEDKKNKHLHNKKK